MDRYRLGQYDCTFGDGAWKGAQMARLIGHAAAKEEVRSYADVGCGDGTVLRCIKEGLTAAGFSLTRVVGYDVAPPPANTAAVGPDIVLKHRDFADDDECFDLVTLNDVIEHVLCPQDFLEAVAARARYVALHIPLDDRVSVRIFNQYNYRIGPVGHISFFNPPSALNLLVSAGLLPLYCRFTPGFLAPSGRKRLIQKIALPLRLLSWWISPGLSASLLGGVSLAVLCRGQGHSRQSKGSAAKSRSEDTTVLMNGGPPTAQNGLPGEYTG
jgi:hypothetical protein